MGEACSGVKPGRLAKVRGRHGYFYSSSQYDIRKVEPLKAECIISWTHVGFCLKHTVRVRTWKCHTRASDCLPNRFSIPTTSPSTLAPPRRTATSLPLPASCHPTPQTSPRMPSLAPCPLAVGPEGVGARRRPAKVVPVPPPARPWARRCPPWTARWSAAGGPLQGEAGRRPCLRDLP